MQEVQAFSAVQPVQYVGQVVQAVEGYGVGLKYPESQALHKVELGMVVF